jgi:hypothetical protein
VVTKYRPSGTILHFSLIGKQSNISCLQDANRIRGHERRTLAHTEPNVGASVLRSCHFILAASSRLQSSASFKSVNSLALL